MKDLKNILVCDENDANKDNYTLNITSLRLRLVYAEFEQRIRQRYVFISNLNY